MLVWIIFVGLTGLVLLALLRPLARGRGSTQTRAAFDATVYRDQLREIESDRERGLIGDIDAEGARVEIARRLLATQDESKEASVSPAARLSSKAIMLAVAALLPLTTLGLYSVYGSPQLPDEPLAARLENPANQGDLQVAVARVEARLREHPEDGNGWDVIAPVYMSERRFADASEAYRQAIQLLGESPKRLTGLGQALVLGDDGVVSEDARHALERSLALDGTQFEPRVLLAIAKEQDGKFAAASADWRDLLAKTDKNAPWRKDLETRLAEDETKADGKPMTPPAQGNGGPSANQVASAGSMSPADRQAMIEKMVASLAQRLDQHGDDLGGWLKLVRAYSVLDRKDDALKALAKARSTFNGNQDALSQLDALATELGLKS